MSAPSTAENMDDYVLPAVFRLYEAKTLLYAVGVRALPRHRAALRPN